MIDSNLDFAKKEKINQSKPSPRAPFPAGTESPFGCHERDAQNPSGIVALSTNLGFSTLPASPCLEQGGEAAPPCKHKQGNFCEKFPHSPVFNILFYFIIFFN